MGFRCEYPNPIRTAFGSQFANSIVPYGVSGGVGPDNAGRVYLRPLVVRAPQKVSAFTFLTWNGGAGSCRVGLYTNGRDSLNLAVASADFGINGINTLFSNTLATPVQIYEGLYWLALMVSNVALTSVFNGFRSAQPRRYSGKYYDAGAFGTAFPNRIPAAQAFDVTDGGAATATMPVNAGVTFVV